MSQAPGLGAKARVMSSLFFLAGCGGRSQSGVAIKAHHQAGIQKQVENPDTPMVRGLMEAASRGDTDSLLRSAKRGSRSNERLCAGYLLYRMNPSRFRRTFCETFPADEAGVQAFLDLYGNLADPGRDTPSVMRPDVKWAVGFWEIERAMVECVIAGEPIAIHRFMLLEGKGDGEIGEGLADDIMDFYVNHPDLVIGHWSDFKDHLDFLDEIDEWYESSKAKDAREAYKALLGPSDPRLPIVLKHFDRSH